MKYRLLQFVTSAIVIGLFTIVGTTYAQSEEDSFFYGDTTPDPNVSTTSFHAILKNDVVDANDGVLKKILILFKLDQFTNLSDASALEFVKYILNIALGLVSFIAFIIVLYWFVKIIFSEDEEGITKAKNTVKGASIAILIISVSWFIVSFLFDLYDSFVATS